MSRKQKNSTAFGPVRPFYIQEVQKLMLETDEITQEIYERNSRETQNPTEPDDFDSFFGGNTEPTTLPQTGNITEEWDAQTAEFGNQRQVAEDLLGYLRSIDQFSPDSAVLPAILADIKNPEEVEFNNFLPPYQVSQPKIIRVPAKNGVVHGFVDFNK
jgi:hypothetical protein